MVRETGVSAVFLLGVMATFLLKNPPSDDDRNHHVEKCFIVPLSEGSEEFVDASALTCTRFPT
jgi:crotonobetaine/carnitine-CoA ligase